MFAEYEEIELPFEEFPARLVVFVVLEVVTLAMFVVPFVVLMLFEVLLEVELVLLVLELATYSGMKEMGELDKHMDALAFRV